VNGNLFAGPHLERVLGRRDLILLFVVAVANLNIVPAVADAGPITLWLWPLALALYFWPQGVAVTELSDRWPGEGGVYLWTKNSFGDMHGFLAGWCYWLANVVYLPTVLLSCIGVGVYIFGPSIQALADSQQFTAGAAGVLLLLLLFLNIRGESAGKWVTNLGGIGTVVGAATICGLAALLLQGHGSALAVHDLRPHTSDWRNFAIFGTLCFSLQGLDLASIMGDEIKEPRKVLPGAILWGGILSGAIYVGVTFSMLVAIPHDQIGVLSGVLQAISLMAQRVNLGMVVAPLALFEFIAILGTASAWFTGTARLPFVAGIDRYLPSVLGRLHPRYHTPHIALTVFAILSASLILMSYLGASVSEAYLTLLSIAVVLQLIPNVYMFCALLKQGWTRREGNARRRIYTISNALAGIFACSLGICVAFIPAAATTHIWTYELKLALATGCVLGSALLLYFRARRKTQQRLSQRELA
jgi:amino acid transporter